MWEECALIAHLGSQIFFQFQPLHLGVHLGAHLQKMLLQYLGDYVVGISFTAKTCATIVPFFKGTGLIDRFLRANPTCLEPTFRKVYPGIVYTSFPCLSNQ